MAVPYRFIGKDPNSKDGESPSLWVDEADDSMVFQLYRIEDPEQVAGLLQVAGEEHVPGHEVLGRLPVRMFPMLQEALDDYRRRKGADSG